MTLSENPQQQEFIYKFDNGLGEKIFNEMAKEEELNLKKYFKECQEQNLSLEKYNNFIKPVIDLAYEVGEPNDLNDILEIINNEFQNAYKKSFDGIRKTVARGLYPIPSLLEAANKSSISFYIRPIVIKISAALSEINSKLVNRKSKNEGSKKMAEISENYKKDCNKIILEFFNKI